MLETISSSKLNSPIAIAEWSPTMDVIAISYLNALDVIEFRRMDWTRVQRISLNGKNVDAMCFSPNGRKLAVASSEMRLFLYNIENSQLITENSFQHTITAIAMMEHDDVDILAVAFDDQTVSLFADFHFALLTITLDQVAIKLSITNNMLFCVLEDYITIRKFPTLFISENFHYIKPIATNLSTYWIHHQMLFQKAMEVNSLWDHIWDEMNNEKLDIVNQSEEIARSFLLGNLPPEISHEAHRTRICKQIIQNMDDIINIFAEDIVPTILELNTTISYLRGALEIAPPFGVSIPDSYQMNQPEKFSTILNNCFVMIQNTKLLKKCINALFAYLNATSVSESLSIIAQHDVAPTEFADFLANFCKKRDLLDISITETPQSIPVFSIDTCGSFSLFGTPTLQKQYCTCLSDHKVSLINLETDEIQEFFIKGTPLSAFPFENGLVGCFSQKDEKPVFQMFGEEDEESEENGDNSLKENTEVIEHSVSLLEASNFIISPRKIALLNSNELFCAVVDLASFVDDEEEDEG